MSKQIGAATLLKGLVWGPTSFSLRLSPKNPKPQLNPKRLHPKGLEGFEKAHK